MASDGTAMSRYENRENSDTRLLGSCGEELARLANIARDLGCSAVIRAPDGTLIPQTLANCAARPGSHDERKTLSVPIYDAEGTSFARIEFSSEEPHQSSVAPRLLQVVVEPLARSLCERLFRIRYRQHWIVAAQRADHSRSCLLLAIDRDGHLVGADHFARQILKERAMELKGLELSGLFQVKFEDLYRVRYHEVSLKSAATSDDTPWFILITPPYIRAVGSDNRVQLHSRPRLESISASSESPADRSGRFGLPAHKMRCIEEFVDARLESGIDVGELARSVRCSQSHFSRMFKRSFGITPHTYIMRCRLALAQELIARTELALAEVALRAGFSDQSHLCRIFRQFAGLAPRAFRMQYRGNDEGEGATP
jgi:AraC-like DNA-binding protein